MKESEIFLHSVEAVSLEATPGVRKILVETVNGEDKQVLYAGNTPIISTTYLQGACGEGFTRFAVNRDDEDFLFSITPGVVLQLSYMVRWLAAQTTDDAVGAANLIESAHQAALRAFSRKPRRK